MKAGNPAVTAAVQRQADELRRLGWYHSFELPDGAVITGHMSLDQQRFRLAQFPIPADLTGKRVLDIGAWDGWFGFELERRGASLVSVDLVKNERYLQARELLGSHAEYVVSDVYDLRPAEIGYFDVVLFLGVLYHLKHPLLALERVCALSTDLTCVESYVSEENGPPRMDFYESQELCGQFDNWTGPNLACLLAFCRTAGFAEVQLESVVDSRAHITCRRHWSTPPGAGAAPYITNVESCLARDHIPSPDKDEYLQVFFKSEVGQAFGLSNVFAEVGPYALRPSVVTSTGGDGWSAIIKLPPGLPSGLWDVRVRVGDSAFSNAFPLGVGVQRQREPSPAAAGPLTIEIVADGKTWERNQARKRTDGCISLWVRGLAGGSGDVTVLLGETQIAAAFVSDPDPQGLVQVNALLPVQVAAGPTEVRVSHRSSVSSPVPVEILDDNSK